MAKVKVIVKEDSELTTGSLEFGDVGVDAAGRHYVKVYVSPNTYTIALLESGDNTFGAVVSMPLKAIHRRNSGTVVEMTL